MDGPVSMMERQPVDASTGSSAYWDRLRSAGFFARVGLLAAVPVTLLAVTLPIAWSLSGTPGIAAAAIAAGVCLAGAVPALAAVYYLRGEKGALYGLLLAITFRMGIPLAFAMSPLFREGLLASVGIINYLLCFYMVTLAVETVLSLPALRKT